ncbi:MAG: phosphatidylcholine synthase [Xanthobacteraceae bacterium]|nr:phosphatidylcholine synthase [Xanthobacteraceae bacterium]
MTSPIEPSVRPSPLSWTTRLRAFGVHIFTALGAGIALIALLEAVREHWAAMFAWLGVALLIDAIDGPIARRLDVGQVLPNWSGDTLDLVVDFTTYVFVPAYAITASGLLIPLTTPLLGFAIAVSGALYFSDRRMKTDDNHFRGFPTLWNGAAFYLFLLKPAPAVGSAILALLVVLTFVPFNVVHPVRTGRFRKFNLVLISLWAALCVAAIVLNFEVSIGVKIALCVVAVYILFSDLVVRTFNRKSA